MNEIVASVPRFSDYLKKHDLSDFGIFLEYVDSLPVVDKISVFLETYTMKRSPSSPMFQNIIATLIESPRLRSALTLYLPFPTNEVGTMSIGESRYIPYFMMPSRDPGTLDSERFSGDCCVAVISISPATQGVLPIESISSRGRSGAEVIIAPGYLRLQDRELIQVGTRRQSVAIYYMNYLPDTEETLTEYVTNSRNNLQEEVMKYFVDFVRQNIYQRALQGVRIQNIRTLKELTGSNRNGEGLKEVDEEMIDIIRSNLKE